MTDWSKWAGGGSTPSKGGSPSFTNKKKIEPSSEPTDWSKWAPPSTEPTEGGATPASPQGVKGLNMAQNEALQSFLKANPTAIWNTHTGLPNGFDPTNIYDYNVKPWTEKTGNFLEDALKSAISGSDVVSSAFRGVAEGNAGLGTASQYLGGQLGWDGLQNLGQRMNDFWSQEAEAIPNKNVKLDMTDPDWWQRNAVSTVASSGTQMIPALLASLGAGEVAGLAGASGGAQLLLQGLTGSAVGTPLEASTEAGGVYDEAMQRGYGADQAQDMADKAFRYNATLLAVPNAIEMALPFTKVGNLLGGEGSSAILKNLIKAGKVGLGAVNEGGQEVLQNYISSNALGDNFDITAPENVEAGVLGALMGGGMAHAGNVSEWLTDEGGLEKVTKPFQIGEAKDYLKSPIFQPSAPVEQEVTSGLDQAIQELTKAQGPSLEELMPNKPDFSNEQYADQINKDFDTAWNLKGGAPFVGEQERASDVQDQVNVLGGLINNLEGLGLYGRINPESYGWLKNFYQAKLNQLQDVSSADVTVPEVSPTTPQGVPTGYKANLEPQAQPKKGKVNAKPDTKPVPSYDISKVRFDDAGRVIGYGDNIVHAEAPQAAQDQPSTSVQGDNIPDKVKTVIENANKADSQGKIRKLAEELQSLFMDGEIDKNTYTQFASFFRQKIAENTSQKQAPQSKTINVGGKRYITTAGQVSPESMIEPHSDVDMPIPPEANHSSTATPPPERQVEKSNVKIMTTKPEVKASEPIVTSKRQVEKTNGEIKADKLEKATEEIKSETKGPVTTTPPSDHHQLKKLADEYRTTGKKLSADEIMQVYEEARKTAKPEELRQLYQQLEILDQPFREKTMPIPERTLDNVGKRNVKAIEWDYPELKPYIQEVANILLGDTRDTIKGERIVSANEEGERVVTGSSQYTSEAIKKIQSETKASYREITDALNKLIKNQGTENVALAKKIELVIDEMLTNGYKGFDGTIAPPNEEYVKLKETYTQVATSKQKTATTPQPPRQPEKVSEKSNTTKPKAEKSSSITTPPPDHRQKTTKKEHPAVTKLKELVALVKKGKTVDIQAFQMLAKEVKETGTRSDQKEAQEIYKTLTKDDKKHVKNLGAINAQNSIKKIRSSFKAKKVDSYEVFYNKDTKVHHIIGYKGDRTYEYTVFPDGSTKMAKEDNVGQLIDSEHFKKDTEKVLGFTMFSRKGKSIPQRTRNERVVHTADPNPSAVLNLNPKGRHLSEVANKLSPKATKEITEKLAKALKTVMRVNRVHRGALGTFNTREKVGQVKRFKLRSWRVTGHELGHAVEFIANFKANKAEMIKFANNHYPDPTAIPAGSKVSEGIAEFLTMYMVDNKTALKEAPQTYQLFEQFLDSNEELKQVFEDGRKIAETDMANYGSPLRMKGLTAKPKERSNSMVGEEYAVPWYKRFQFWVADYTIPMKDLFRQAKKNGYRGLDPAILQAISGSTWEKAFSMFRGKARFFDTSLLTENQRSLGDLIKHVEKNFETVVMDGEEITGLEAMDMILKAFRYLERWKTGKFNDKLPYSLDEFKTITKNLAKNHPELVKFAKEFSDTYSEIKINMLVKGKALSAQEAESIKKGSRWYIPLHSISRRGMSEFMATAQRSSGKGVKEFKSATDQTMFFLEAVISDLHDTVQTVEFNRLALTLEKALRSKNMGLFGQIIPPPASSRTMSVDALKSQIQDFVEGDLDFDDNQRIIKLFLPAGIGDINVKEPIVVARHGDKLVYMRVAKDIYESLMSMKPITLNSALKALTHLNQIGRVGGLFSFRTMFNMVARDTVSGMIQTKTKTNVSLLRRSLEGFGVALGQNKDFFDFYIQSSAFGAGPREVVESALRASVNDRLTPTNYPNWFKAKGGMLVRVAKSPLDILRIMDEAPRLAEFSAVLRDKLDSLGLTMEDVLEGRAPQSVSDELEKVLVESAYASREVLVNFGLHGTSEWFRKFGTSVQFFQGAVQGMYRMGRQVVREAENEPSTIRAIAKGTAIGVAHTSLRAFSLMIPLTLMAWNASKDDEKYINMSSESRDRYWWFPIRIGPWDKGDTPMYFAIAKPYEYSLIVNTIERALDASLDHPNKRQALEGYSSLLSSSFSLPFMPMILDTAMNLWAGKDDFGNDLVPQQEQGWEPYLQYGAKTSQTATKLSEALYGIFGDKAPNPREIDYAIKGIFGSFGKTALVAGDFIADDKSTGEQLAEWVRKVKDSPDQATGLGQLVYGRTEMGSRIVDKFYADTAKAQTLYNTLNVLIERGTDKETNQLKPEALKEIQSKFSDKELNLIMTLTARKAISKDLSNVRSELKTMQLDKDVSTEDKKVAELKVNWLSTVASGILYDQPIPPAPEETGINDAMAQDVVSYYHGVINKAIANDKKRSGGVY